MAISRQVGHYPTISVHQRKAPAHRDLYNRTSAGPRVTVLDGDHRERWMQSASEGLVHGVPVSSDRLGANRCRNC